MRLKSANKASRYEIMDDKYKNTKTKLRNLQFYYKLVTQ